MADPLFQPGMAAFVAPAVKSRLLSPSCLEVLDMIYESRFTRLDVLV